MKPAYAMHRGPYGRPVLFKFRSPRDRDAYVAEAPHYRSAVPPPDPDTGFTENRIALESGRVLHVESRPG